MIMRNIFFIVTFFCCAQLSLATTAPVPPSHIVLFRSTPSNKTLLKIQELPFVKSVKKLIPHASPNTYFSRIAALHLKSNNEADIKKLESLSDVELVDLNIKLPIKISTINPIQNLKYPVSDPFFGYQWYLKNIGQTLDRDIDDINLYTESCKLKNTFQCEDPEDVGISSSSSLGDWWKQMKKLEALSKREVIVAVVDGGIDVNHPDLKNSILKKKDECTSDGSIPANPKPEKYGKDYPGDCMGWNFVYKGVGGKNDVSDSSGHGTHLAGIIAAQINNNEGIAGISSKIKILPIKVFQYSSPIDSKENKEKVLLTDRFIQAMYYAIHRNVDIINLSFGWPAVLESKILQKTFAEVVEKGITIVAAAGNSAHDTQIFPCAYDSVICVGATSITGAVAKFSNYGGHVDFTAPGVEILSTYPKSSFSTRFFHVQNNYNILSGTSQATAIISGMAGILKSIYPDISSNELRARLIVSAHKRVGNKPVLDGTPRIWQAVEAEEQVVVRPDFKGLGTLRFFMENSHTIKTSPLNIKIKSLWKKAKNIRVRLKSHTPNYTFTQKEFNFSNPESQEFSFPVSVNIKKIDEGSHFSFDVSLWANGKSQGSFSHRVDISRNIEKDTSLISFPLVYPTEWETREDMRDVSPKTIHAHLGDINTKPEYMIEEPLRENEKYLKIHVFRLLDNKIKRANTIEIPNASLLIRIMRIDLNYDGKLDYLVISAHPERVEAGNRNKVIKSVQYSFVKHDFSPLLNQQTYSSPVNVESPYEFFSFYKKELDNGRHIALPIFHTKGRLINSDRANSIFSNEEPEKYQKRIYYLDFDPNKHGWMNFYAFENALFKRNIKEKLNLDFYRSGKILQILPQPSKDFDTGTTDILFRVIKDGCYILSTGYHGLQNRTVENIKSVSPDLCSYGSSGEPVIEFTDRNFKYGMPLAMYQIQNLELGFTSVWDSNYKLRPGSELLKISEDLLVRRIQSHLATFTSKNSTYSLFEETDGLVLLAASDSKEPVYSRFPLVKSSLLPGFFFHSTISLSFFGGKDKPLRPAFEVDYSPITKKHLFLLTIDKNGKLYAPTRFNLHIPEGCSALDSASWEGKSMAFVFYCAENRKKTLKFLPIR